MFTRLFTKAILDSLKDERVHRYKMPDLSTPEYGAAHRSYKSRVYKVYAVMHVLDWLNFPDGTSKYIDSSKWSKDERANHLRSVVGKHRRRVR